MSADADGAYEWSIPQTLIGSVQLVATGTNGSVSDTASVTVTMSSYSSGDVPNVIVDFFATYFVAFVGFAGLLALVMLLVWFRKMGGKGIF